MFQISEYRTSKAPSKAPMLAAALVVLAGGISLLVSQAAVWDATRWLSTWVSIKPNTAIGLVLAGFTLALQSLRVKNHAGRRAAQAAASVLALCVLALGLSSLVQSLFDLDLGIDRLFFADQLPHSGAPGRMAPLTAICLSLAGISLLLLDYRHKRGHYPAEYGAIVMAGLAGIPFIGYLYSATSMVQLSSSTSMAPETTVFFFMLAFGILAARPDHPLMRLWRGASPGGLLMRSLLPASLLLLVLLDFIVKWGVRNGVYGPDMASPVLILASSALLFVLFCRAAAILNSEHESRRLGEAALAESNALLRVVSDNTPDAIFVKDRSGRMIFANPATLRLLDKKLDQVIGRTSADIYAEPADAARIDADDRLVMASGVAKVFESTLKFPSGERTLHAAKAPWLNEQGDVMGLVGISTDITDRKRIEDSLKEHETQLEALVAARTAEVSELIGHLESTREEEKRAIARELHDDLGSSLTALNMHLAILFQQMPPEPRLTERSVQVKALLTSVTNATRRIQIGLRPDKLDVFGIKAAITEQAVEFEKYTGVPCHANLPDEGLAYAPRVDIALFRMVQEVLNNIAKHAQATRVDVVLDDTDDEIALTIRDNGVGMAVGQPIDTSTHGLRGMRERAGYLGGTVKITSAPGKGTTIQITIPKTGANMSAASSSDEHIDAS
jgi:PAS domain S-box-containing protein